MNSVLSRSSFTPRRPRGRGREQDCCVFGSSSAYPVLSCVGFGSAPPLVLDPAKPSAAVRCCLAYLATGSRSGRRRTSAAEWILLPGTRPGRQRSSKRCLTRRCALIGNTYSGGSRLLSLPGLCLHGTFCFFLATKNSLRLFPNRQPARRRLARFCFFFFSPWHLAFGEESKKENAKVMRAMARQHRTARIY